ncbi:MAG: UDP-N-acetylglucosamine 1-carboxyvinyltransferase [Puniceicoccales bacterium]|jgi:UDP-N-acetylglucosamine 1-carboxyvinyltransferase|nr:UDP-N-acetylglucosamine 1-carboxyvinyltransferase [Puniceicoccales bacterium]
MDTVKISGGKLLHGSVDVSGSKNTCLPVLAACLLTAEPCVIKNVPSLSDVTSMIDLIKDLGVSVESISSKTLRIHARNPRSMVDSAYVNRIRASVCLMGALLGRTGEVSIPMPGGCVIGERPIDLHLRGFQMLGANILTTNKNIYLSTKALVGNKIYMSGRYGSTVTGTANLLMASVLAQGQTMIYGAACEPEVVSLCKFLTIMGAKIDGLGTSTLVITGVDKLHGCEFTIGHDRIEAGTFVILGLACAKELTVNGISHSDSLITPLLEAGADMKIENDKAIVKKSEHIRCMHITTSPFPGFPTDLHAQLSVLMTQANGISTIEEKIYPERFGHVPELVKMKANIKLNGTSEIINGRCNLQGNNLAATDLRAGAALYIAGLLAKGETIITNTRYVDRGYDHFNDKLKSIGADVCEV